MDTLQRRALEKQQKLEEQRKEEQIETYQIVLTHLLDEGYASTPEAADKIILNMSESWFENIMEKNRYEKETGKDYKTGKPVSDAKDDKAYTHVKRMMRGMEGKPEGQRKKEPGKKPPKAGEYGGPRSPEQKVKMRRAAAERSKDMMHSARD